MRLVFAILLNCAALFSAPVFAQMRQAAEEANTSPAVVDPRAATTGKANGSRIGQRQTREAAAVSGIKPMARINSRIANRVQSRLRNRIDQNYDPQANAASPFAVAEDQARRGTLPR